MRYLAEGRIIPERVDISIPRIEFQRTHSNLSVEIIKGRIFVHLDASTEVNIPDVRNELLTLLGNIINLAGFNFVLGISYELDSITSIDGKWTQVFGTEGFVFEDNSEFGNKITFTPQPYGSAQMSVAPLNIAAVSRATFELRNSIRYPDYTALHCRLALEAIRNHFDADDERLGWQKLRETLNIDRQTIELFQDAAAAQRHGNNMPQSWPQRRQAMQVAWEICHRFLVWLEKSPQTALEDPDFPHF